MLAYSRLLILLIALTLNSFAYAASQGLAGYWRSYDDTGQARSIVQFYHGSNGWNARIVKTFPVSGKDTKVCSNCRGAQKNKPLAGMVVVWGLQQEGDHWINGSVLDVDSGKTYGCSITLSSNGQVMHFYAYYGPFGKTVNWMRAGK